MVISTANTTERAWKTTTYSHPPIPTFDFVQHFLIPVLSCIAFCVLYFCLCSKSGRKKTRKYFCKWFEENPQSSTHSCTSPRNISSGTEPIVRPGLSTVANTRNVTLISNRFPSCNSSHHPPYDSRLGRPPPYDARLERPPSYDSRLVCQPSNDLAMGRQPSNDSRLGLPPSYDSRSSRQFANELTIVRQPSNGLAIGRQPSNGLAIGRQPSNDSRIGRPPSYNSKMQSLPPYDSRTNNPPTYDEACKNHLVYTVASVHT